MRKQKLLEVENLKISFRNRKGVVEVVHGVDFSVEPGEILGIAGESGCGKSITSLSVLGLLPENGFVSGGRIIFDGQSIDGLDEARLEEIRGNEIAMIFQDSLTSLNPTMKVGRQLMEPLLVHENMSNDEAKDRVITMLKEVGISSPEKRFNEYPHQLSGGMRQRVMIAMGLLLKPKLLIADEPTTALDVSIQAQILELMSILRGEIQTAIMLITHDMGVIAEMSDNVLIMYAGRGVEYSDVNTLFHAPKHPYTQGLLESIPKLNVDKDELFSIEGSVPSASNMPAGCAFEPRCTQAIPVCRECHPDFRKAEPTRVSCHLYE